MGKAQRLDWSGIFLCADMLAWLLLSLLCEAYSSFGVLSLHRDTFDKVASIGQPVLVLFGMKHSHTKLEGIFNGVASEFKRSPMLFAEVIIPHYDDEGYGDSGGDLNDNYEIHERWGFHELPRILLFSKETGARGVGYNGQEAHESLSKFLTKHVGFLAPKGQLEAFNALATEFRANKGKREAIREKAEKKAAEVSDGESENAKFYARVMKKILEKGDDFILEEEDRVSGLMKSIRPEKHDWFQRRLNILHAFHTEEEKKTNLENIYSAAEMQGHGAGGGAYSDMADDPHDYSNYEGLEEEVAAREKEMYEKEKLELDEREELYANY